MNQIPPLAWILIVVVVLLTAAINFGLIALLRNRSLGSDLAQRLRARRPNRTAQSVQRFQEVLRDPFRQEREQLNELSDLVTRLNSPSASSQAGEENTRDEQPVQRSADEQ
jgi:hypothetical protein